MSAEAVPYLRAIPTPPVGIRLARRFGWQLAILIEVVAILALWEIAISGLRVWDPELFPPPSAIAASFVRIASIGYLGDNVLFSLGNFAIGYVVSAVLGVTLGLLMGTIPAVAAALGPFVWTLYSTPRVALAPLLVIWLGFGAESKIAVIVLMAVFPILLNVMVGAQNVDRTLLRAGMVFGASRLDLYRKVVLPYTLPYTITGLRLGVARALVGVVIGEFIGSAAGLGYIIVRASASFDLSTSFAVVLLLLALANVTMALLDVARRRVAPWYRETPS